MRILFILTFTLCSLMAQAQVMLEKSKKKEQRIEKKIDTSGIDPFTTAARVELITYTNRMEWWFGEEGDKPFLKNGKLNMPVDSVRSRVQLGGEVARKWRKALYVTRFCEDEIISFCYEPRHMLLFYGPDNKIFGCIEICISCAGGYVSEGLRKVAFCPERVEYIAKLIKGIQ